MRTLFLSKSIPGTLDVGGQQRLYHMLRAVSAVSDVTFVCATLDGTADSVSDLWRQLCVRICPFPVASFLHLKEAGKRLRGKLRYLDPRTPVLWQWLQSEQADRLVSGLCREPFDLVWMDRLAFPHARTQCRTVVDLGDLEHRKLERQLKVEPFRAMTLLNYLEVWKLRRLETNLERYRDWEFSVCSSVDRGAVRSAKPVWVVPNGIDVPAPPANMRSPADPPELLFLGTMSYPPNIDAVRYFLAEILPRIRQARPGVRLSIVGKDPGPEIRALHNGESVVVAGTVPDVAPYLRRASVVIAPIRVGGGTRIKILEAMANRRPVVATTIGAEGLDVESGKNILLADSPGAFAAECLNLLADYGRRSAIAAAAYRLVQDRYRWESIEKRIQQVLRPEGVTCARYSSPTLSHFH